MVNRFNYFLQVGKDLENQKIETNRLFVRRFVESDFEDFYNYISNEYLCFSLGWPMMKDRNTIQSFFNRVCLVDGPTFAIVYKETNHVIGNFGIGLCRQVIFTPDLLYKDGISLSYALHQDYQRQGLLSELLETVIPYLFNDMNLDYINCGYFYFNEASKALQIKFGFKYYLEHYLHVNNQHILTIENILYNPNK